MCNYARNSSTVDIVLWKHLLCVVVAHTFASNRMYACVDETLVQTVMQITHLIKCCRRVIVSSTEYEADLSTVTLTGTVRILSVSTTGSHMNFKRLV